MRFLIATGLYPPEIGGPATHTVTLERYLPQIGITVSVLPFASVRRHIRGIRHLLYFFACIKALKGVDLLYALDPFSVGLPALLAARIKGVPFVLRVAGDYAWEQGVGRYGVTDKLDVFASKTSGYGLFVSILKRVQLFVARNADLVIVPSEYMKKIVHAWGVDAKTIEVVYTSFEPELALGNRRTLRGLLRFKGKMIISIGRLVPWKGFTALIELVPELVKRYADMRLFIVGSGPDMPLLEKRIKELDIEKYVSLGGSLDHEIMLRYIQAADVFVLNTNYEGFSHLLLEVMSVGTPIVTTNVGGNTELIEHDKNGLLVGYNNKKQLLRSIVQVLDSPVVRKRLVDGGVKELGQFTHQKMIERLVPLLLKVLRR
jgi:glycosyltransferase involved in cell wall biosynthesis